ncbi:hypothetical protein B0T22DRAFT_221129 [Podospora appendiculata]|uniref:Uncharacterized protein n=1 Tax=Podospora appendiculata TaxID=314037 RepID=A0AAE1CAH7_9PEZI|nr:hypothetical protein B0T22DRAFT_221129 [Podospora appendiculata]
METSNTEPLAATLSRLSTLSTLSTFFHPKYGITPPSSGMCVRSEGGSEGATSRHERLWAVPCHPYSVPVTRGPDACSRFGWCGLAGWLGWAGWCLIGQDGWPRLVFHVKLTFGLWSLDVCGSVVLGSKKVSLLAPLRREWALKKGCRIHDQTRWHWRQLQSDLDQHDDLCSCSGNRLLGHPEPAHFTTWSSYFHSHRLFSRLMSSICSVCPATCDGPVVISPKRWGRRPCFSRPSNPSSPHQFVLWALQ